MNCQQIQSMLDESDIAALGEEPRREIEEHLSGCADCAGEWRAFALLHAAMIPDMPRELPVACRTLVARQPASHASRNGRCLLYTSPSPRD